MRASWGRRPGGYLSRGSPALSNRSISDGPLRVPRVQLAYPCRERRGVLLPPRDLVQVLQELDGLVVLFRLGEHGQLVYLLPVSSLRPAPPTVVRVLPPVPEPAPPPVRPAGPARPPAARARFAPCWPARCPPAGPPAGTAAPAGPPPAPLRLRRPS